MSRVAVSREKLVAVADAVRAKTGGTESLTLDEIQKAVETMSVGTNIEDSILDRTISGAYVNDRITEIGSSAFRDCLKLTSVSCANVTEVGARCFYNCSRLVSINLPNVTSFSDYAVYMCGKVTSMFLPKLRTTESQAMARSSALVKIKLPSIEIISATCFDRCSKLTALILPGSVVAILEGTAFTNTPIAQNSGYIYVPAALVDSYKAATNWSTYASQIRAIEDYPEITGGNV